MSRNSDRWGAFARVVLALVRLFNGVLGLIAPAILVRRLGDNPAGSSAALYAFRLFGVRTILLGVDLLADEGPVRNRAIDIALLVHASDTVAAAVGGLRREVPPRVAAMTVFISGFNTILAITARRGRTKKVGQ